MLLAADFGTGEVLWSFLWFFLFFVWIMLIFSLFGDIMRSHDLSGWGKALWAIAIILFPFIGIFVYLIVRGGSMAERQGEAVKEAQAAQKEYIRHAAGTDGSNDADQLSKLADLHAAGKLDDAEYSTAKAKVIGS